MRKISVGVIITTDGKVGVVCPITLFALRQGGFLLAVYLVRPGHLNRTTMRNSIFSSMYLGTTADDDAYSKMARLQAPVEPRRNIRHIDSHLM